MSQPELLIVVVSYNSAAELPGLAASLGPAAGSLPYRAVVVDNGSSDGSAAAARSAGLQVVPAGGNLGYSAAINVGRALLTGERALLIANPDVRFGPGSIRRLFDVAMAEGCVAVPRILDGQRRTRPSLRREPTLRRQFGEALLGDRAPHRTAAWSIIERSPAAYDTAGDADWATGAALLIPRACDTAVGAWDEEYFLYSEEVDFCRRARMAGFPVRYVPDASIHHAEGASGRNAALVQLDAVNRIRYYRRWHGPGRTEVFGLLVLLEKAVRSGDRSQRLASVAVARQLAGPAWRGRIPDGRSLLQHWERRTR